MDQSASVLGINGSALYISFHPTLDAKPVAFPKTQPELTFVIADTLVTADKHSTGPVNYNLRVVECTLAAQILAKKLNLGPLPEDAGPLGNTLKGLMDVYFKGKDDLSLEKKLEELVEVIKKNLDKEEGYTREEMAELLDTTVGELVQRCMVKFPSTTSTPSLYFTHYTYLLQFVLANLNSVIVHFTLSRRLYVSPNSSQYLT
jgi:galactokinase